MYGAGAGWTDCTLANGQKYWVNLGNVLRMVRDGDSTTLKFSDGSTLDIREEPFLLIQRARGKVGNLG